MHEDTQFDYNHFLKNLDVKPNDVVAEYKLGRALLCGNAHQILDVLSELDVSDFYDQGIQVIYNTVKEEFEKGEDSEGLIHFSRVVDAHRDRFFDANFKLNIYNGNQIGGIDDFGNLKYRPDEEETKVCIRMVKNKRNMRDMIRNCFRAADMCRHLDGGVDKAYDFMREIVSYHDSSSLNSKQLSQNEFADMMLNHFYDCNDEEKREQQTINMPWKKFQQAVGGFRAEQLVIVSAKSGQGKSAFSLNIGIETGVTQKIPTLYINSELSNKEMAERYLSYTCYIDSRKIREGKYRDENDKNKVTPKVDARVKAEKDRFENASLKFLKIPDLQVSNIEKSIQSDCVKRHTRLVIVDYIGRMDITKTAGVKDLQEWQIMRLAANRLKSLAQKYHVCIIMVCQLTDEGSLQGSKAMKNEADMWLSINRLSKEPVKTKRTSKEDFYDEGSINPLLEKIFPFDTLVKVEKARGVSDVGAVTFRYEGSMMRFCDTEKAVLEMVKINESYGVRYANEILKPDERKRLEDRVANGGNDKEGD